MATVIIFIGLLIFFAHLCNAIFSKQRIPDVLLLLGIGILIGPVLNIVKPDDFGALGSIFSSLTLLFILFDNGVDMSIDSLRRYWKGFVQVTFLSFIISMTVVALIGRQMGFEWRDAWLMGSMLAGTAAAIVIPLVKQMKVSEYTATVLCMEGALSAVLCIVVSLSVIDGYEVDSMGVAAILGKVIATIFMSLLLGVVGGILWSGVLVRVRKLQNSMFLTPAFVFIVYGVAEALGYNGPISALAIGIVLGNIEYFEFSFVRRMHKRGMASLAPNEKSFYKELVFVLKTFFFVYIGICIPFTNGVALLYGLVITMALFVVRFALIAVVGRNNLPDDRLTVSMMIPKGLASAALAALPEQVNASVGYELIPGATMIKYVVYSVIFFSIIVTSILVLITRRRLMIPDVDPGKVLPGELEGNDPLSQ